MQIQDTFSISGRDFLLTLIARRSRHYAGTRFLNIKHFLISFSFDDCMRLSMLIANKSDKKVISCLFWTKKWSVKLLDAHHPFLDQVSKARC